jgi:hypothetical protein
MRVPGWLKALASASHCCSAPGRAAATWGTGGAVAQPARTMVVAAIASVWARREAAMFETLVMVCALRGQAAVSKDRAIEQRLPFETGGARWKGK